MARVSEGDTVVHENLGTHVLVLVFDDASEVVVGVKNEAHARHLYRTACEYDSRITYGYNATRKV